MPGAVPQLEKEFAARFGFAEAVGAGFARAALFLALRARGAEGSDVLVPDFICSHVLDAIRAAGARPALFRVNADLAITPEAFASGITALTRAAILPHYFGIRQPHTAELVELCASHLPRIFLIEDCAMALGAHWAGRQGDAALFSFTKSHWSYGGGMLACDAALAGRMREMRRSVLRPAAALEFRYGLLRRADFTANRPARARPAELAGRMLEWVVSPAPANFYDLGRWDAGLSERAARRALALLERGEQLREQRRRISGELHTALSGETHIVLRRPAAEDLPDFLVLRSPLGRAAEWVREAAEQDVTLRRVWPAYQAHASGQAGETLEWLARHVVYLEVHPQLTGAEVRQIAATLTRLARRE